MIVYHAVNPDSLQKVLQEGLKKTSRGDKGDDSAIARTDHLLDVYCPESLRRRGVSRDDNLYVYLRYGEKIVSIKDGSLMSIEDFIQANDQVILELEVNPTQCFVSDIDSYDAVRTAIETGTNNTQLERVVREYWDSLIPLESYMAGSIRRPEGMVTYDVPADMISKIS